MLTWAPNPSMSHPGPTILSWTTPGPGAPNGAGASRLVCTSPTDGRPMRCPQPPTRVGWRRPRGRCLALDACDEHYRQHRTLGPGRTPHKRLR
jgi:hypothetical protein